MSNSKSLISVPIVQKTILLVVVGGMLIVLIAVATGNFAPLMTSELGQVGICETNDAIEIRNRIQGERTVLYICGTLVGETKRDIGFDLFFEGQGVYSKSEKLRPGEFWIPIHALGTRLNNDVFPFGKYEIRAAYGRDPSIFVGFAIDAGQ